MKTLLLSLFVFLNVAHATYDPSLQNLQLDNMIKNYEADTNINGWTTYKDAASADPVDGTGGTSTFTFTRETSSPLRGAASFLLTKPASNVQGEGFSYDFTIDSSDKGKVLQGSFDYQIASGTFADDALTVWIYDITNSRLIQPAPTKLKNSGIIERFPFEFQTSIDSTSYRLIVHQSSTSAAACTIKFDNFRVGPTAKAYGSTSTTPVTATYTLTNFGNATVTGTVSREGVYANFKGRITIGSTLPSGIFTLNLPSGYSMTGPNDFKHGAATVYKSTAVAAFYTGQPYSQSATTIGFAGGSSVWVWTGNTVPAALVAGDYIEFDFRAQIQGWSSSQIMSSDADTRVVAFNAEDFNVPYPAVTTPIIINATPRIDTHSGYNSTAGEYTIKVSGIYKIQGNVNYSIGSSATGTYVNASVYKNGSPYNPITHRLVAGSVSTVLDFNRTETLEAGDVITLRILATNATLSVAASNLSSFSVERISGPSQIAASESVSALYTGAPPTGVMDGSSAIKFGTKVKDSHGAYNTTTGEYRVPMSGVYTIASEVLIQGVFVPNSVATLVLQVDSVPVSGDFIFAVGAASYALVPKVFITSIPLLQGQILTIKASCNGTTPGFNPSSAHNYFSITRTGQY